MIAYAIWAYDRFAQSTADLEDLLAERGVIVSRVAIRLSVSRFGCQFAGCLRRNRSAPNNKWHLDEVFIAIQGEKFRIWQAVGADGEVLDILVQRRRNAMAAKRLFRRLVGDLGELLVVIPLSCNTAFAMHCPAVDKLRRYGVAKRKVMSGVDPTALPILLDQVDGPVDLFLADDA